DLHAQWARVRRHRLWRRQERRAFGKRDRRVRAAALGETGQSTAASHLDMPRLLSLNVGLPKEIPAGGEPISSGIWKASVTGPVMVRATNPDGDRQADLTVHGGPNKAVYGYPSEHYAFWRKELPGAELPPGAFGENLTTEGLTEEDLRIGDEVAI